MTDDHDTIPAPAPEHNERCRHTDCVGECRRQRPPIVESPGRASVEGPNVLDHTPDLFVDANDEACANMPKAEEARRPKVGDRVRIRAGSVLICNEYPLQPATVTKVTPMGGFCARPDTRKADSCPEWGNYLPSERGTMWTFADEPATKRPDGLTERERGAWEINEAWRGSFERAPVGVPWKQYHETQKHSALAVYDRAEQLFKAKADERVRAAKGELYEGMARVCGERNKARAEVERLSQEVERLCVHRDAAENTFGEKIREVEQLKGERDAASRLAAEYKESQVKLMRTLSQVQAERTAAWQERDELATWKAGALDVLLLWDDVATEALGGRTPQLLGESKAAEILKVIRGLREEVKELARKLEGAKAEVTTETRCRHDVSHRSNCSDCMVAERDAGITRGRRELVKEALQRWEEGETDGIAFGVWLRREAAK